MDPLVIKLGGALLEDRQALKQFFTAVADYKRKNSRMLVIIHGGGCAVDNVMQRLGLPVVKLRGRRVTPADQIAIVVGMLAGTANKILLAEAKKHQLMAVGLSLADGDSVSVENINKELGYVGQPSAGKGDLLYTLSAAGYLPIMSSIGIDKEGNLLNVNSDEAAVSLTKTLNADLLMLADVGGVLDENGNFITRINRTQAQKLIAKGLISGGMVIKVEAALMAAKLLNKAVSIAGIEHTEQLIELFNGKSMRTTSVI